VVYALVAFALSAALLPRHVAAQTPTDSGDDPRPTITNAGSLIPFLEGTDVFFALHEDTVFEADIMPHLVVFQTFSDVVDISAQRQRGAGNAKRFAYSISGTPAVRLRMFDQVSRPVRTPSYMPRGNVQLIWARNIPAVIAAMESKGAAGPGANQVSLWEGHAIVGHHSNGQDGCFWDDQARLDDVCVSVSPVSGERLVNKQDGSFSTNYVRVGINYRRNLLDEDLWAKREWGFRADLEYHPRAWMDEEMVDIYGRTRVEFAGTIASRELSWCPKRAEATGAVKVIGGHPESVWPVAVTIQGSCFPTRQGGWGIFLRFYGGQDYYNLGLLDNIQRVHFGATFNQSGFFRFRRPNQGEGSGGARP
jgi:hypothetical protein